MWVGFTWAVYLYGRLGDMSDRKGIDGGRPWRRTRLYVLERDGYVCQLRLPGCLGRASTADHIVPLSMGGPSLPENLRAACLPCNLRRGARDLTTPTGPPPSPRWSLNA